MAISNNISDYTNRDYSSLLTSLLDQAAQKLPEWTDRSENDIARMLLEMFAYTGDVLLYYQDRIANEAFLSTAVERRSVIDLLGLIGYTLTTPAPASAELTITVDNDKNTPIIIKPGATFATDTKDRKPGLEFIYFPPSESDEVEIKRDGTGGKLDYPPKGGKGLSVINASLIAGAEIGTSNGQANQSFKLAQKPVILPRNSNVTHYLKVDVGGKRWTKKDTLLYSLSADEHYIVKVDENDEAEIIFGDGQYGKVPSSGQKIVASYLTGGGKAGNVPVNTITVVKNLGEGGSKETVKIHNPNAASGGEDRESIEHAKLHAPGVFRSLKRAVTEDDYVALAKNFPGVAHAKAIAPSWNYVDIYVVSAGNFHLTDNLRAGLMLYFEDLRPVTTHINIREPEFMAINIQIGELGVEGTYYQQDVERRARSAVQTLFIMEHLDFGQIFYLSKVYEALENVDGVSFVGNVQFSAKSPQTEISSVGDKITLSNRQFPQAGQLTIKVFGGL